MAHGLILGMTESGKTTLARKLAAGFKRAQIGVLVLDPMKNPDWNADFITDDPEAFLQTFWASECCAVFLDESGDTVGRYDLAMIQTATKGRHFGHSVFYLSQRGAQLSRTVRDQCSFLALFRTSLPDAKIHAAEWARPELVEAASLSQGDFLFCGRYHELIRANVFTEKLTKRMMKNDTTKTSSVAVADDRGRGGSTVGSDQTVDTGDENS